MKTLDVFDRPADRLYLGGILWLIGGCCLVFGLMLKAANVSSTGSALQVIGAAAITGALVPIIWGLIGLLPGAQGKRAGFERSAIVLMLLGFITLPVFLVGILPFFAGLVVLLFVGNVNGRAVRIPLAIVLFGFITLLYTPGFHDGLDGTWYLRLALLLEVETFGFGWVALGHQLRAA